MKTIPTTKAELLDALSLLAVGRGTHTARLARMHRLMLDAGDAMQECTLPSGAKRVALTEHMSDAQTPEGKRYPQCIVCAEAMSTEKGPNYPAYPTLMTLIPSILYSDDDVAGTDKATAHRLGYAPGNVALACLACSQWKTARIKRGDFPVFDAETLGDMADKVLLSWEGVGYSRKSDTESEDAAESRDRREAARIRRGYVD